MVCASLCIAEDNEFHTGTGDGNIHAALDNVSHLGIRNIEHHEHKLTEYAREQLAQVPGLTLIGDPKNRVSVVSFVLDGIPVPEVGTLLDKEGIAVRAGHHCAQSALRALGYEMSVRPTKNRYNATPAISCCRTWGVEGQEKIMNAKVFVVGAGGLDAPVCLYLAAAGIGRIGIIDIDVVDLSNLQRQVIYFTKDMGMPKVESAKEKILAINPDMQVDTYREFLYADNTLDIIKEYDFIVDGTDNFYDYKLVIEHFLMYHLRSNRFCRSEIGVGDI